VVAIYQLSAARGQLNDMGSQLDVMRKDQRAWIAVDVKDHPNIAIGQPLSVELNTKNTGKTPATRVAGTAYIELVPNGSNPHFESTHIPRAQWFAGVLPPNSSANPQDFYRTAGVVVDERSGLLPPDLLTESEKTALDSHHAWIAIHGLVEYDDTFKITHWIRFCYPAVTAAGTFQYAACTKYNSVDDN
jgi:hypothetical protein